MTLRKFALIAIPLALLAVAAWIYLRGWAPSRDVYPMQGVSVGSGQGEINWSALARRDADFAYIRASAGAGWRDPAFAANWAGARGAGLRYGAQHDYSLCAAAGPQGTAFISTVPRDNGALPAVVRLDLREDCAARPARATVLADLNTLLVLIEAHSGKPAIIRVSRAFNEAYDIGGGVNRTLWLEANLFPPDYAGRPWVMWTASTFRHVGGIDTAVEWNVVRPR